MAKVFMPSGSGGTTSAGDTDVSGLLNLMCHCTAFGGVVEPLSLCGTVRLDVRNPVMHSASFSVDKGDFESKMGLLEGLLSSPGSLSRQASSVAALAEIKALCTLDIVAGDEQDALQLVLAENRVRCVGVYGCEHVN
jgi:hypothetical protein